MSHHNRGFTLVEVILALVVLSVGVLGLASSAALTTRMIAQGQLQTKAAVLATRRLEALRSSSCPAPGAGRDTVPPFRLSWTVEPAAGRTRTVNLEVAWPARVGERVHRLQTLIACGS